MSGDGGGFFNANSAHPFENPSGVSNSVEIVLMLLIPASLIRTLDGWSVTGGKAGTACRRRAAVHSRDGRHLH